jgi:hypothetical protein
MASLGIAPELVIPDPNPTPDPLFLERLEAFLSNNLETQLRAFCERERYPFEEVCFLCFSKIHMSFNYMS